MVDTPTSLLPNGGAIQTTDQVPVNRGGGNVRTLIGALAPLNNVPTARIDNDAVTFPKMQNIATQTLMGRTTAATGDPEALTATQARTLLNVEDGSTADQVAADVPFTPNGTIAATDTQSAVQEVRDEAPLISSEDETVGQLQIAVVATLPGTPDASTVYLVTT